jgi:hypothetical protein
MIIAIGLVMALLAVLLVLEPVLRAATGRVVVAAEPIFSDSDDEDDPLLARRDRALAALKEIDFDRATGKLSDEDYERMKTQFTAEALDAIQAADAASAPAADVEALIASARGAPASRRKFCVECGAPLESGRFCVECGAPVAAMA